MKFTLIVCAALAATVIPIQAIVNGRLGQTVGNPFLAALISFIGGTVALALILLVTTPGWPALPGDLSWSDIPPYLFTGGLLGAVFVTAVLTIVPRIGTASVLAAAITGQLLMALVVDHFGLLNVQQKSISLAKIVGCGLMILGVLLLSWEPARKGTTTQPAEAPVDPS
ncbi:MAG: DMT family transporter [Planctomycetaceae bacterium]